MKELENFLQNVAQGLRSLACIVEALADKSEKIQDFRFTAGHEGSKNAEEMKVKSGNGSKRRKIIRKEKAAISAETIYQVIKSKKAGIDTFDLMKETDFEEKKVRNIIYKLKKQNRIKNAKRGIYIAS